MSDDINSVGNPVETKGWGLANISISLALAGLIIPLLLVALTIGGISSQGLGGVLGLVYVIFLGLGIFLILGCAAVVTGIKARKLAQGRSRHIATVGVVIGCLDLLLCLVGAFYGIVMPSIQVSESHNDIIQRMNEIRAASVNSTSTVEVVTPSGMPQ